MTTSHHDPLRIGDRLPDLQLPDAASGRARPVRGGHRDAVVLVALQSDESERCHAYLTELARARADFQAWDGRTIAHLATQCPE